MVTLVLLGPLCAEVTVGNLPFTPVGLIGALFTLPIYGADVLLARELVRRAGRGWPSLLLLGAAYGTVEEQLGLGSFTSPSVFDGIGPAMGGAAVRCERRLRRAAAGQPRGLERGRTGSAHRADLPVSAVTGRSSARSDSSSPGRSTYSAWAWS